jgi:hypothetical protein
VLKLPQVQFKSKSLLDLTLEYWSFARHTKRREIKRSNVTDKVLGSAIGKELMLKSECECSGSNKYLHNSISKLIFSGFIIVTERQKHGSPSLPTRIGVTFGSQGTNILFSFILDVVVTSLLSTDPMTTNEC